MEGGGSPAGHGGFGGGGGDQAPGGLYGGFGFGGGGGGGGALGGAIFNDSGSVTVRNSTFTTNFVARGPGAISPGGNGADAGGAIFSRNGSLTVLNSTISLNQTTGSDGGIAVLSDGATASFTLRNTIIANNGVTIDGVNFSGTECSARGSLVTKAGSGNIIITNDTAANACPCDPCVVTTNDPNLGVLQLNAPGNTPTMAIDTSSSAFDAGDDGTCLDFDQRGISRPQSAHCDIGAYEVGCSTITCPADITQSNDPGQCGANVTYPEPTVDGSCPVECSAASGSFFPAGTTTVTCEMGSASCSFNVTVNDTESPTITCPSDITVSNDAGECGAVVTFSANASDNCPVVTVSCTPASGSTFPGGATTVSCNATDTAGNSSNCSFTVTVNDTEPPVVSDPSSSPALLWPPNHKMRDVAVNYTAADNCPGLNCGLSVASSEPLSGTGDGDTAPDWEIVAANLVRLRAERAGTGNGRIYTIAVTCTDGSGNATTKTTAVVVAHNIIAPLSGAAFKINTPVNFAGTFWDVPGKTHTAQWDFGGLTTPGIVTEPRGLSNGTVKGTYIFSAPGVYKITMKLTDDTGFVTPVTTAGDLEAIVVIYDPSGGYTIGGGWVPIAAGSYPAQPSLSGKLGFGFNSKYTKAANPKGTALVRFALGDFEFSSLNYDYLAISGSKAQFKGFGQINGDAGYNFILTVIDGGTSGGDKFRIKIWKKTTGAVVFDNQMGASDVANPITPVGVGSSIVVRK